MTDDTEAILKMCALFNNSVSEQLPNHLAITELHMLMNRVFVDCIKAL